MRIRNIFLILILTLCIALAGCASGSPTPPPPPIDVLSAAVTAAEIAEPVIAAAVCAGSSGQACLTPLQEQSLMAYMNIVATGLAQVSIIEAKTETTAQKALETGAVLGPIIMAAPVMANVPPNIKLVVTAVIAAVQLVNAVYGAQAGTVAPAASPRFEKPSKPARDDLSRLSAIHQRCVALQGKIATAR